MVCLAAQLLVAGLARATTLPDLIQASLFSYPSIRAQEALVRAAEGGASAARWQYLPTPSIGMERVASSAGSYSFGDSTVATLRLQQPLWTGGRLTAGLAKAKAGVAVGLSSVDVARQDLALRVVQAYAEWSGGVARESAYEKSLQSHLQSQSQMLRRIKEGVSPQTDLLLVQGRIEQTRSELIVAQAQQSAALSRLSQMLARTVRADELRDSLAQPLPTGRVQDMVASAQAGSPNVARLVATARMQQKVIDERRADLSPEVYLRMERQYGNFSFRGAAPENRLFFGVSTRFGAGFSAFSGVDAARASYEAALADIDTARVALSDQITADHLQLESGKQRLLTLKASLDSTVATSQAWNRQFLSGQKSWLDVMNSVREVAQVETQIADVNAAQLLLTWRLGVYVKGVDFLIVDASGPASLVAKADKPAAPEAGLILRLERVLRRVLSDDVPAEKPAPIAQKTDRAPR